MRFLHLSDLHIGRRLYQYSLLDDQRHALKQLLKLAESCDAVLIAGDLYDRFSPSAEAVRVVGDFLVALSRLRKPVLVCSGNHDSAEQVAYCRELMALGGVYISPAFDGTLQKVVLHDEHGALNVYLMPYLKPAMARPYCPEVVTYEDAVRFALSAVELDTSERNVLVAHQFVAGAQSCQSETLSIGGVDEVATSLVDGFDYVALGHLHSPQRLAGGRVCYCGSPLKYSLSEAVQRKAALLVTLGEKGELSVQSEAIAPLRDVRVERGKIDELCRAEKYSEDYVYAVLEDEGALIDPIGTLRVTYPNLLGMRVENDMTGDDAQWRELEDADRKTPLEHFMDFYRAQTGDKPPDERRLGVMRAVIEEAEAKRHEAGQA